MTSGKSAATVYRLRYFQEASLVYQRINRSTFSKKSKVSSQE
ncbi:hypothetical protein [Enterococcus sp. DIV2449a]